MDLLKQISEALQVGDHERVAELTRQAIDQQAPPASILDDGLIGGMDVIGERFRRHEIFLPEVLMAAKAMYSGLELLKPLLIEGGVPSQGKIVIGSVQGDLHDIGKNLVGIMLTGAGFEVIDLGSDVAPERFVETASAEGAAVIGMSALLTTTMTVMKQVVELARQSGLSEQVKIIVGGAPVSQQFADEIQADAYGFDAANAVDRIKMLVGRA